MDTELKTKWIAALRSGDFKQTSSYLRFEVEDDKRYCCLGVLCIVAGAEFKEHDYISTGDFGPETSKSDNRPVLDEMPLADWESEELNDFALNKFDIPKEQQYILTNMNDDQDKTFSEIADYIEENL